MMAAQILWRVEKHIRGVVAGELGDVILRDPRAAPGVALKKTHSVSPRMCIGADIDISSERVLTATWYERTYIRPLNATGNSINIRPVGGRGGFYEVFLRLGGTCAAYHRFGTGVYAVDADGETCLAPGRLWEEVKPVLCDPRLILGRSAAGGVMLWDICSRAPVTTPRLPTLGDVDRVELAQWADFLVTASADAATLWRLHATEALDSWRLRPGRGALTSIVFSASGGKLALLDKDSGAYFWRTRTWLPTYLGACTGPQEPWAVNFSMAEDHAVVAGWEATTIDLYQADGAAQGVAGDVSG